MENRKSSRPRIKKRPNSAFLRGINDETIDDFLKTPIDSRFENEEDEDILTKQASNPRPITVTVKPSNYNNVLFDWDSTIKKLSNKIRPVERTRPKSRGLPDIAKREIQKENEMLRKNTVERVSEIRETKLVYPLRKNELPLLRKAPGVLRPLRPRRRYD